MTKVNKPENPLTASEEEVEGMMDLITSGDSTTMPQSRAVVPQRSPLPWIGSMPRSSFGVMAVVNEDGYLVPVCTAGDLLRACKIIWQATED